MAVNSSLEILLEKIDNSNISCAMSNGAARVTILECHCAGSPIDTIPPKHYQSFPLPSNST